MVGSDAVMAKQPHRRRDGPGSEHSVVSGLFVIIPYYIQQMGITDQTAVSAWTAPIRRRA
jgi:hypothetical protein